MQVNKFLKILQGWVIPFKRVLESVYHCDGKSRGRREANFCYRKRQAWVSQKLCYRFWKLCLGRWLLRVNALKLGQLKETVKAKFSQYPLILKACFLLLSLEIQELRFSHFWKNCSQILSDSSFQKKLKSLFAWNLDAWLSTVVFENVCSNSYRRCVLEQSLLPTDWSIFWNEGIQVLYLFLQKT